MDLKGQIEAWATEGLPDPSLFLVSVTVSERGKMRVSIFIDGDRGVNIDQCAAVSRHVAHAVETHELIEQAYELQVSSPGVGEPLLLPRQYPQHVGRRLSIKLADGTEAVGKLLEVGEAQLLIDRERKEKRKLVTEPAAIGWDSIAEAKVLISF
jgi:ribosome maturation factor RimP